MKIIISAERYLERKRIPAFWKMETMKTLACTKVKTVMMMIGRVWTVQRNWEGLCEVKAIWYFPFLMTNHTSINDVRLLHLLTFFEDGWLSIIHVLRSCIKVMSLWIASYNITIGLESHLTQIKHYMTRLCESLTREMKYIILLSVVHSLSYKQNTLHKRCIHSFLV